MPAETGRRERNKLDKQERIFAAAAELIGEKGYRAVTTQQIAERAGVTNGTLFRYAATKAELLLMVMNAEFAARIDEGRAAVASQHPMKRSERDAGAADSGPATSPDSAPDSNPGAADEVAERVMALLTPIATGSRRDPHETTSHYQRELLFGEPTERYRAEGLALTDTLQGLIAEILRGSSADNAIPHDADTLAADATATVRRADETAPAADPADTAARAISNVLHLEISRAALESASPADLVASLARQVALISSGYLRSRHPHDSDAHLTESPTKED